MKSTRGLLALLLSVLLAATACFGTTAYAASEGLSFTCPETVHAGGTFTVTVDAVEGAQIYTVAFWLDGNTSTPPTSKMLEGPGSFTLGPLEPGLYRVQVSVQSTQWDKMRYNVIPVTVSATEATGPAMSWSSETSGWIYSNNGPSSAPAASAIVAADDPLLGVWGINSILVPNTEGGGVQLIMSVFFSAGQYEWITFYEDGTCQIVIASGSSVVETNTTWTRIGDQILLGTGAVLSWTLETESLSFEQNGITMSFRRRGAAPVPSNEEEEYTRPQEEPLTGMDEVEGIWRAVAIGRESSDVLVPLPLWVRLGLPSEPTWIGALLCSEDQVFAMYDGGIMGGKAFVSEGMISTQTYENNPITPIILRGTDRGWLVITFEDGLNMYYERMSGVEASDLPLFYGQ